MADPLKLADEVLNSYYKASSSGNSIDPVDASLTLASAVLEQAEQIKKLEQRVKAKQAAINLRVEEKMVSRRKDGLLGYGKEVPVCSCGNYIVSTFTDLYELRLQGVERIKELERELEQLRDTLAALPIEEEK